MLSSLLKHAPFAIPLIVLCLSEITKAIISHLKSGTWHEKIFLPGGFPSTHSAFTASLLVVVGHISGIASPLFAVACVLAGITWYDAIFVRRELGIQAHILNQLQHTEHLRERLGHSLVEVIGGVMFGGVVTGAAIALS